MSLEDALAQFSHDARGSLGALRLALGSARQDRSQEGDDDALLAAAEEEISRLTAALVALPPLALLTGEDPSAIVDLRMALAAAIEAARRYEVEASVVVGEEIPVRTSRAALERVLLALLVLAAGADGATEVSIAEKSGMVVVSCSGTRQWPQARHLAADLVSIIGATLVDSSGGLAFSFGRGDD